MYPGDYLRDTMHLTTEQHGAYHLLILAYWQNGGPLLESRVKMICDRGMHAVWDEMEPVLSEFFDIDSKPGYWVHKRIEHELKEAYERHKSASERGKIGAKKRWG